MATLDDVLAAQQQYQAPPPASQQPAAPQWQTVAPYAAPGTGYVGGVPTSETNLSPEDYQRFMAGQQPQGAGSTPAPTNAAPPQSSLSDKLAIINSLTSQPQNQAQQPASSNQTQPPPPSNQATTPPTNQLNTPLTGPTDELTHGFTFGLSDYAGAAGKYAINKVAGAIAGRETPSFAEDLAAVRAPRQQFEQEHPIGALATGLLGGAASGQALSPLFGTAEGAGALGQIANYARNTAAGAAVGGAQGAIEAPGDATVQQRLTDAGKGALVGGALTGVTGAVEGLWNAGRALYNSVRGPLGIGEKIAVGVDANGNPIQATSGQLNAVAQNLARSSGMTQPELAASIPSWEQSVLVPGSEGTMGQILGNEGLLNRERLLRAKNREPFNAQDATANTAQLNALRNFADPNVHAEAAGSYVLNRFRQLNAAEDAAIEKAAAARQQQIQAAQAAEAAQQNTVSAAGNALGGNRISGDAATARQQYGSSIRESVQQAVDASKANISRLYEAIDPEGKLALPIGAAKEAAKEIRGEMVPGSGARLTPAEEHWVSTLEHSKPVVTYKSLQQTRRELGDDIRQARMAGRDNEVRRLTMLREGLDQSVANAVENAAHHEAPHINAGHSGPDESIVGRLAQHAAGQEDGDPAKLASDFQKQVDQWRGARAAKSRADAAINARAGRGARTEPPAGRGPSAVPGADGAAVSAPGRSGNVAGGAGGPEPVTAPLEPNFDAEAAARDAAARSARREHAEQFAGAPKDVTARANDTPYKVPDSQVASRFWNSDAKAAENAQSLVRAVGRDEAARQIGDYVAFDMRSRPGIVKPDGTFDSAKLSKYIDDHKDAFAVFPEIRQRFGSVTKAQQELDALAARRAELEKLNPAQEKLDQATKAARLKEFQDSAASFYLDRSGELRDPQVAIERLMNSNNPGTAAAELMRMVGDDGEAKVGVQRNVVDWLLNKTRATQQAGVTGEDELKKAALKNVVRNPKMTRALEHFLTPEQNQMLRNVVADQDRRALAYTATGVKGSPGTAADLEALGHGKGGGSVLTFLVSEGVGELAQMATGAHGVVGMGVNLAAGAGALLYNAMRHAGMKTIQDLEIAAVLHPTTIGKTILSRPMTPTARAAAVKRLAGAINATAGYAAGANP